MSNRNSSIDNIRGISLLGVIAIHAGSLVLQSPNPNLHLYILFEILSRYSVPAFFFISGYGLFAQYGTQTLPSYKDFIYKRLQSTGIPYLCWSLIYLSYFTIVYPRSIPWGSPFLILHILFFGLACYHLYFLVILLWFYLLFPLWQRLYSLLEIIGFKLAFTLLFFAQLLIFQWHFSYSIQNSLLKNIIDNLWAYRLNYVPFYYIFVFMLGAVAGKSQRPFLALLLKHFKSLSIAYIASILFIAGSAYYYFYNKGYDLLALANTFHQLSLQGLIYTIASVCFFYALMEYLSNTNYCKRVIACLSDNSFIIYLIHPFWLDIITHITNHTGIVMTTKRSIIIYIALVSLSLLSTIILKHFALRIPYLSLLLTGKNMLDKRS